jgi:hypothetical protein
MPGVKVGDIPYDWLRYLQRAIAYAMQAPKEFRPVSKGESPAADKYLRRELTVRMQSHIACHSDHEGFFVPVNFRSALYDEKERLCGAQLGSSIRGLQEMVQVAPLLDIPLRRRKLAKKHALVIAAEREEGHQFEKERKVWLELFQAFQNSVALGSVVVYT